MRLFSLLLFCLMLVSFSAHAQRSDSIAAVVNDDIITFTDVYDRIDMVIKSSGMPNNKEFKERLLPQVLTGLITESVQIQEAQRLGLQTSSEEIEEGFAKIAEQNNLNLDQFKTILRRQNVRPSTIERQVLAQLAWGKVIQREIRPRVVLGDDDIESEMERLKSKEGQTEYSLAEIVLPIDGEGGDEKTLKVAKDLTRQLSRDIQKFPVAARQFSQSASAANGGIIGWVTADQLSPALADVIENLETRKISEPVKTEDGYVLLFIREKRLIDLGVEQDTTQKLRVKLTEFSLPDDEAGRQRQQEAAEIFARDVKGCLDIVRKTANADNAALREIYDTTDAIPSYILEAVQNRSIGEAAQPIVQDNRVTVAMLCGRDGGANTAMTALERDIENRMGMQRMDILQKRYLRDLIAEAYIERRI
jgi:peptidyl-prolyl cis-trans isomerase SurA